MYGGSPKVYHAGRYREERGMLMESDEPEISSPTAREPAARLAALRTEHRDLDSAIEALSTMATSDDVQLARLKKRKLRLKDEIAQLEDITVPDIIA